MASDTRPTFDKQGKQRVKVALQPGFHLADWMQLVRGGKSDLSGLKGGPQRKITRAELAEHASKYDCWTAFNGKVFNISQYMHYHPGGLDILMEHGAGKDCTDQYNKYHKWVNINSMLSKCVVGTLVDDEITSFAENSEDSDDGSSGRASSRTNEKKDENSSISSSRYRTESEILVAGKRTLLSETSDDSDADVKGGAKDSCDRENKDAKTAHDSKDRNQNSGGGEKAETEAETALHGVSDTLADLGISSSASPKK